MRKKVVWLVVSGLMSLSLVMAACAPAAVEEEKAPVTEEKAPEQKVEEEVVAPTVETPKYGGQLKIGWILDTLYFDAISSSPSDCFTLQVTNESLWAGDWTRGPAGGYGTNETNWTANPHVWELYTGEIAESYELPTKIEGDLATVIWHIRKGVHFALNPESEASRLVGGRELTAYDVAWSLQQAATNPRADLYKKNPELRVTKITALDKWTVKVEFPWDIFEIALGRLGDYFFIVPPEVYEKYGDMTDWKVSVGTGPFMLTDVVPGSTATFVRNPNYWGKDPIGPGKGNQLPYLDGVKFFTIPDMSTLHAALRTARTDWIGGVVANKMPIDWENADQLLKTAPQLMYAKRGAENAGDSVALKIKNAPFNDIRVRRALMMAINFETIKRDLYGGRAQYVVFPVPYLKELAGGYFGPDEQGQWPSDAPESVKELYSYNPEKARELLAEAGYPQGFKTNLIIENRTSVIDYYSVIKDMWAKAGVDVELRPKETAAFNAIRNAKDFDQMIASMACHINNMYKLSYYYGKSYLNASDIDDPVVNEAYSKIQRALVTSRAEANRLHRELSKYVLDQVWVIPKVTAPLYNLWWPWLKNYSGETNFSSAHAHFYDWVWIDQELKKSMGY